MKWFLLFVVLPVVMFFLTFAIMAIFAATGFSDPNGSFFSSWYLSTVMVICTVFIVRKIDQGKK